MSKEIYTAVCPSCGNKFNIAPADPETRAMLTPIEVIRSYRITTDEIQEFLRQKMGVYKKADNKLDEAKLLLIPMYTEQTKKNRPHQAYCASLISFSEHVLDRKNNTFFSRIGESSDSPRFIESIYNEFIKRYQLDIKDLDIRLSNYKKMEELEERFGMKEEFLQQLQYYARPRRTDYNRKTQSEWIVFAANTKKIIEDMLSNSNDEVDGVIEIYKIQKISDKNVEFIVYVHRGDTKLAENPLARELIMEQIKLS
jgi:hypothetical protein